MFDRHQAEITVMQFTGHSLPVHHSVAAQWDLHLVPYYQLSSPARFLSINGHWDVSLPLSLEWHVCPGRRSKYNNGIHSQRTNRMGDDTLGDALRELVKSLSEQVSVSRLPPPEPRVFYGDPMRYPSWRIAFQTLIEHRRIPAGERLHYLKKYIGGQVKDKVES